MEEVIFAIMIIVQDLVVKIQQTCVDICDINTKERRKSINIIPPLRAGTVRPLHPSDQCVYETP